MTQNDPMFYIVLCGSVRCRALSLVETFKTNEAAWHQCPECGGWNERTSAKAIYSSDIESIDDGSLYRIWSQISSYIMDAAKEDSLVDGERERLGKLAEDVVDALASAPDPAGLGPFRSGRPVRAYTFAVLLSHGEWFTTDPMNARSEDGARRLVEKVLEDTLEHHVVSGIHLIHIDDELDLDDCTCDDVGDGPCPVHAEEMAEQDARIESENKAREDETTKVGR